MMDHGIPTNGLSDNDTDEVMAPPIDNGHRHSWNTGDVLTTGDVARICKVATRTVSKWFDAGLLKGHRVPGSKFRRFLQEDIIAFLKDNGMPLGVLEDHASTKILIVARDEKLIENLKRQLPFEQKIARSSFEAGIEAKDFHPDCVICDFSIGSVEALQICKSVRQHPDFSKTIVIALLPDDGSTPSLDRTVFDEVFKKPFDAALLAERLRTLVGARTERERV